jgi:hypothetical protein
MDGFGVETAELRAAASGIAAAIGAADDTNLEDVPGKGQAYGNGDVSGALSNFCTTWELAKQILQSRSASAGEALEGTANAYDALDQGATTTFAGGR